MVFFQTFIKSISSRSKNVIKNILLSVGVKAVNVLCSLVLVPLSLGYLSKEEYGIWLTISTMLLWISFFDIGLGNGLRNYLSEAISKQFSTYLALRVSNFPGIESQPKGTSRIHKEPFC